MEEISFIPVLGGLVLTRRELFSAFQFFATAGPIIGIRARLKWQLTKRE